MKEQEKAEKLVKEGKPRYIRCYLDKKAEKEGIDDLLYGSFYQADVLDFRR